MLVVLLFVTLVVAVVAVVVAAAVNANVAMMIVILIVLVLGDDVRILSVLGRVGHNDTEHTYIIASKRWKIAYCSRTMVLLVVLAEKDPMGMEYLVKVVVCENTLILYQFGTRKHPS